MEDYMGQLPEISTPICDFVQKYAISGTSRFHMPGHKGAPVFPGLSMEADITEIAGADCLFYADGIIRESEHNASLLFGTGATFYSVEGSSQCIRAMLTLVTGVGTNDYRILTADDSASRGPGSAMARDSRAFGMTECAAPPVILAARNVHRSFLTAAALLDLDVRWLYPESSVPDSICSCPVTAKQVRKALSEMDPLPAAVYLTSPDYLGMLQDIKAIAEAAHDYGVPLLVDNAHGAYLHFLEQPVHPIDLGADMCCDSAHKTLPALTGCAYLHISEKAAPAYAARARKALSFFGSTSPSWLLLGSLDYTNKLLSGDFRERLAGCVSRTQALKNTCLSETLPRQDRSINHWFMEEPLKITIQAKFISHTGTWAADLLRKHQIECEYADPDHVVLMVSPYNTPEDMIRLESALQDILTGLPRPESVLQDIPAIHFPLEQALSIRKAALAPSKRIFVDQAAGQVCTDLSLACPPGIPVVVCGEIITNEAVRILKHYKIREIEVLA